MSQNNIHNKSASAGAGRAWAKRLSLQSRQAQAVVMAIAFILYALAFFALIRLMGSSVVALALLPIVIAGWLQGMQGGLLVAALCFPLSILLLNSVGMSGWKEMIGTAGGASGTVLLFFVGGIVGRMSDLTRHAAQELAERKQSEAALRESEQRLRTIIETEPECVKVVDGNGHLLEINAAGLAMLEADSLDEVQQHTLQNFILPEYRSAFVALHKRVMGGESGLLEFEVAGLKGTRRWLETHAAPVRDAAGNVEMLLGITRDITERKRAEDNLRESEDHYRLLVETLPDGVVVHSNGLIIFANRASATLIGAANPSDLIGKPAIEFVHPDYRDLALKRIQQSLSEGVPSPLAEEKFVRQDGTPIDVEVSAIPFSYGGKPAMLTVFNDITKRKRTEEDLVASEAQYRRLFQSAKDLSKNNLVNSKYDNLVSKKCKSGQVQCKTKPSEEFITVLASTANYIPIVQLPNSIRQSIVYSWN